MLNALSLNSCLVPAFEISEIEKYYSCKKYFKYVHIHLPVIYLILLSTIFKDKNTKFYSAFFNSKQLSFNT